MNHLVRALCTITILFCQLMEPRFLVTLKGKAFLSTDYGATFEEIFNMPIQEMKDPSIFIFTMSSTPDILEEYGYILVTMLIEET